MEIYLTVLELPKFRKYPETGVDLSANFSASFCDWGLIFSPRWRDVVRQTP